MDTLLFTITYEAKTREIFGEDFFLDSMKKKNGSMK
jgi:hypothetical protein